MFTHARVALLGAGLSFALPAFALKPDADGGVDLSQEVPGLVVSEDQTGQPLHQIGDKLGQIVHGGPVVARTSVPQTGLTHHDSTDLQSALATESKEPLGNSGHNPLILLFGALAVAVFGGNAVLMLGAVNRRQSLDALRVYFGLR